MHRLVDAQPLNVWPVEHAKARIRHLLAIVKRLEGDIPGLRCWLEALEKRAEREAIPRHDDAPGFDAAMAVDALFECAGQQRVDVDRARPESMGGVREHRFIDPFEQLPRHFLNEAVVARGNAQRTPFALA